MLHYINSNSIDAILYDDILEKLLFFEKKLSTVGPPSGVSQSVSVPQSVSVVVPPPQVSNKLVPPSVPRPEARPSRHQPYPVVRRSDDRMMSLQKQNNSHFNPSDYYNHSQFQDYRNGANDPSYPVHSYNQPRYDSRYNQPSYNEPRYNEPRFDSRYDQPRYQQPRYEQPRYEQSRYNPPHYSQPGYTQPGYNQPQYNEPGYQSSQQPQKIVLPNLDFLKTISKIPEKIKPTTIDIQKYIKLT